jgi:ribonuclease R
MVTVNGFTIDGPSSKDLDDAVWSQGHDQHLTVQIHITDVASLVPQGSYLDRRAAERIETRYLRHGNRPMLPRSLSEASASLLPGQVRPVITTAVTFDPDFDIVDVQFYPAQLTSRLQLDYETADQGLQGQGRIPPDIRQQLTLLEQVAQRLTQQRRNRGALLGREIDGQLISEDGQVIKPYRSQQIIMELMILSNQLLADYFRQHQLPALYRNHTINLEALGDRSAFLAVLSQLGDAKAIQQALGNVMGRAKYGSQNQGHMGLELAAYCHGSSPIRRYADLVNQRILKAFLAQKPCPYDQETLAQIASLINQRQAQQRQQKSEFFKSKAQAQLQTQVKQQGLEQLEAKDFSKVIKAAIASPEPDAIDYLQPELSRRIATDQLMPVDYYQLLLLLPPNQDLEIQTQILEVLNGSAVSISILTMAQDKWSKCDRFRIEVKRLGQAQFAALAVVDLAGQAQSPPEWGLGSSKAQARQQAAHLWLTAYVNDELMPPAQVPPPTVGAEASPTPQAAPPSSPNADPVSQLNLLAQQAGNPLPEYQFEEVRSQYFRCQCTYEDWVGEGKGQGKKQAKREAAAHLWQQLEQGSDD